MEAKLFRMCRLADEIVLNIEHELSETDGAQFSALILRLTCQYAEKFVPEEFHAEFFGDLSDNLKTLCRVSRTEN